MIFARAYRIYTNFSLTFNLFFLFMLLIIALYIYSGFNEVFDTSMSVLQFYKEYLHSLILPVNDLDDIMHNILYSLQNNSRILCSSIPLQTCKLVQLSEIPYLWRHITRIRTLLLIGCYMVTMHAYN